MGKKIALIGYLLSAFFALSAFTQLFQPVYEHVSGGLRHAVKPTGWELVFGSEKWGLKFSFMNFLTYFLLLIGVLATVLLILQNFGLKIGVPVLKNGKLLAIIAVTCFVLAAAFFSCMESFIVWDLPKGVNEEEVYRQMLSGSSGNIASMQLGLYPYYNGGVGLAVIVAAIGMAASAVLDR